ncbi:hypothetical protein YYC_03857 [Plasmodium yoelii 17X]|uniref:Uncharacterized protein n=1 Tax=Plasmodium yoelii 17X TaxID=1323249 RepID=V7PHR6_PLAYE|nr:hypothetical protein YYC_03857 [Plasmodium yoelii 17X]
MCLTTCGEFDTFWKFFSDELNESKEYDFKSRFFNEYCPKHGNCNNDIDKINAGSLWLFNKFYGNRDNFSYYADENINIVIYFMIWLGHKLNQKLNKEFPNINEFYNKHMKNANEYQNHIDGVTGYKNYIELINKHNYVMNISNEKMSKFYDLFKNLCNMYINIGKKNKGGIYLEYAKKFANEYKKLFNDNDNDNNEGNSYNKILSALSSDYYNFGKNKVDNKPIELPSLPTKKTAENGDISYPKITKTNELSSGTDKLNIATINPSSNTTLSGPSLVNKLISIPFIFVVILILLGIAYKCAIINLIDKSFGDNPNNPGDDASMGYFNSYCPDNNYDTDDKKISSTFTTLLNFFESIVDENLESDKLAEYAILWLSYILNQKTQNGITTLNKFYAEHIEKNSCYNKHITTDSNSGNKIKKEVIETKIESMNIDIKDISNFYDAFKSLCNMYSELDPEKNTECKTYLENAGEFFEKYEKLKNALNINKGSSYLQLLSSLSNDYKNLENKYNNVGCNYVSPFVACPRSSVTKNIIITIGIIFVAASILLGVSYKRNAKKIKKKLIINILFEESGYSRNSNNG